MSPSQQNRRFLLASRPHGEPTAANFRLDTVPCRSPARDSCCCVPSICRWILICAGA